MKYIEQAYKGANNFWRYLASFIAIVLGWQLIGIMPLTIVAIIHCKDITEFRNAAMDNFMNLGINSNLFLALMLFMFVAGLATLFLVIKGIHKRSITSLITSREKVDWKRFFFAFGLWFGITLAMLIIGYFSAPENFTWNFKPIPFLLLILISFLLMPLQTSFEELLFRGYFMQGIGVATIHKFFPIIFFYIIFSSIGLYTLNQYYNLNIIIGSNFNLNVTINLCIIILLVLFLLQLIKLDSLKKISNSNFYKKIYAILNRSVLPLILTSVIFGLLHGANPEVDKLGPLIMVYYIGTGFFLGILTLMDEGTELSLGFHAANNIAAAIFITQTWTVFQTEALLIDNSEPSIGYETFLPVFILYPLLLFVFSKKYNWSNWKNKIFGNINKPKTEVDLFFDEDTMLEL